MKNLEIQIQNLEKELKRLQQIWGQSDENYNEYLEKQKEKTILSRALYKAKGEEYAMPVNDDLIIPWSYEAPNPIVTTEGSKVNLTYRIDYDWLENNNFEGDVTDLIFEGVQHVSYGEPSEDNWDTHSLWKKGLEDLDAAYVENSAIISNLAKGITSTSILKHVVFLFKDNCFECVAERIFYQ